MILQKFFFHFTAVALLWGSPAFAYEKVKSVTLFNGETLHEYKLENGFRVLFVPRHRANVLTYQVWFGVGSVDEKLDPKLNKTGLAHLFEHMMFRGTPRFPDGRFDEITSRMGAERQNATTSYYRTNYFQSVPSSQLEKLMDLESDRMRNLQLTATLLEKEKGAVVGELRRHLDSPNSMAWKELAKLVYETSPYRWTVIGTEEEIKGFTLEEGQYFYKTFYAPNNATLIVVGDTKEETLLPLTEKYYGTMKKQEIPRAAIPDEPVQKKERRLVTTHPQATSELLVVAYRIPPVTSPETVALSLLGSHLSVGMESRLRKVLVDKGIAVGANAAPNSRPDIFEFSVQLAENHRAEQALKIIDKEVASVIRRPISQHDFERALNQDLLQLYAGINNDSSMANWLGEYLMMSGNYLRGFEMVEESKKVKPVDIQKAAKKYLVKENRSIVIMTPEKATEKAKEQS